MDREEIEKLVEEEVEKRVSERLDGDKCGETSKVESNSQGSGKEVSRRDFLKKVGAGAAGLGALSILPSATAFNIRSSNPLQYFGDDQSNPNFSVSTGGVLKTKSISADEASFGLVSGQGNVFRLIDRKEPSSDTGQIQFTGLNNDTIYRVVYTSMVDSAGGNVVLRLNGDGSGTAGYFYFNASGTKQANQDEIMLFDLSDNSEANGVITLWNTRLDGLDRRVGINHRPLGGFQDNVSGFGTLGGKEDQHGLSSIELIAPDVFRGGQTVVELWGRDWS